eukprot:TRINITY_DN249_c0_g1_i2.p1 TRINITY_DN249_c0_g1~~TRINITY_DN249_c0_g1_i2.p1  ORF type:complete len:291 (+),score=14.88 TRINITY_DN249_c0_g1_i2:755-1627(+)
MKRLLLVALASTMCTGATITGSFQAQKKTKGPNDYVSYSFPYPSAGPNSLLSKMELDVAPWGTNCFPSPSFQIELCFVPDDKPSGYCFYIPHSNVYQKQLLYPSVVIEASPLEIRFTNENYRNNCGINVKFSLNTSNEEGKVQPTSTDDELHIQWKPDNASFGEWIAPYSPADQQFVNSVHLELFSWGTGCDLIPSLNFELCSGPQINITCVSFPEFQPQSYGPLTVKTLQLMSHVRGGNVRVRITNRNNKESCGMVVKGISMNSSCDKSVGQHSALECRTVHRLVRFLR